MELSIETLRGYKAFSRIITQGRKYEKKPVKAFIFLSESDSASLKIGYAVSKNIRKAVHRNRIKRLMREAFRFNNKSLIDRIANDIKVEIVLMFNENGVDKSKKRQFFRINQSIANICAEIDIINT